MRHTPTVLLAGAVLLASRAGAAEDVGRYRVAVGGRIEAVRAADVDGDGRIDLVVLVSRAEADGRRRQEVVLFSTPEEPVPGRFFPEAAVRRLDLEVEPFEGAGAVAIGRFGPAGETRLRFFGPEGITDVGPDGTVVGADPRLGIPTRFGRSPGRPLVFWDVAADLDGDGRDEVWFPDAVGSGRTRVLGGRAGQDRVLDLPPQDAAATTADHALARHTWVPSLVPADLDGDGRLELVALADGALVAWSPEAGAGTDEPAPPSWRLPLGLWKERLEPEEIHTPRIQLADVDGDGVADLLVTLVTGRRAKPSTLRTRLLHFPGPFRDPATGALRAPAVRIDTESIALHPRFVDLDGDGALDYVGDSMRGNDVDLIRRVIGAEPTIWYVGFRFDRSRGTFETTPYFGVERPYSRQEAMSNRFGLAASFAGDFDGDGHADLLDLGNLEGAEILGGVVRRTPGLSDPVSFSRAITGRVRAQETLVADAIVRDLDGDGRADAVLWSAEHLYLLVPRGGP